MELITTFLPDFISSGAPDILATSGSSGANNFLSSDLGKVVKGLAGAVGFIVAIFGVFKAIGAFLSGRVGNGIKVIFATILIAGILFRLDLLVQFATWLGDLIGQALSSAKDVADG